MYNYKVNYKDGIDTPSQIVIGESNFFNLTGSSLSNILYIHFNLDVGVGNSGSYLNINRL